MWSHRLRVPVPCHTPPRFSAAAISSSERPSFACGLSQPKREVMNRPCPVTPWSLVIMAPAPSFHLGRNMRPLLSQLLPEAVASLLELMLPFGFLLLLLMN